MNPSEIQGLSNKILQAKVSKIDASGFYFGSIFPIKKVNAFTWKSLTNQNAGINVAADIVADGATLPRKKRPIFQSATGDLPKLGISRSMTRGELKEYQTALAMAGDPMAVELVDFWANDVDFCFLGVQAQLEFIALSLASNAGSMSFTTANNATFANEFDLDYQVDGDQKKNNSVSWATSATADPIGDFKNAVTYGKAIGSNIKHAWISLDNFYKLATCDQIIKASASFANNALGIAQTPNLATINAVLATQAWLNGIQLHVIDTTVTRELANGTQTSANPFADNVCVFTEGPTMGSTQYDILNDNSQVVTKAIRSHTIVKKYSTPEPLTEVTMAEADAIPVLDSAYKNIYMKTNAVSW